jgi:RND family efflux transporter MFP subunit
MLTRLAKVSLPLIVLAAAAFVATARIATRPKVEPTPPEERVWTVAAVPAIQESVQPTIRAFGEVVTRREVELHPLVAGPVIEVGPSFVDGGFVQAGDLLIAIETLDYETAIREIEAQIAETRSSIEEYQNERFGEEDKLEIFQEQRHLNRRDLERREKLVERGTGTQKSVDDARFAFNTAATRVIETQQTIARLTSMIDQRSAQIERLEATLERAREDLRRTRLKAPFDGFLSNISTTIGRRVSQGDRIGILTDANQLEVKFHLSDRDFARLVESTDYVGRQVTIIWRIGRQEIAYNAAIDRIDSAIDPRSGGIQLFARIEIERERDALRPGAFVEVHIPDRTYENVIRIPKSAIYEGNIIYLIRGGRLEPTSVNVLAQDGATVLVRGDFSEDELIVTSRFAEIGPGVRVRVQ